MRPLAPPHAEHTGARSHIHLLEGCAVAIAEGDDTKCITSIANWGMVKFFHCKIKFGR